MRHKNLAFLLACLGLLTVAVASAPVPVESAPVPQPGVSLSEPDACPALPPAAGEDFTPVACRMMPECWADSDCGALCGTNGGRCVHSKCPIRICKCN